MEDQIRQIRQEALAEIDQTATARELKDLRVKYLGKKGSLTNLLRGMGGVDPSERPRMGQLVNEVKEELDQLLDERERVLEEKEQELRLAGESIDVTLPGRVRPKGNAHPLQSTLKELQDLFISLGYEVVGGPEVELDYYNFEALNVPPDHPARDLQDTFYLAEKILLRTQTSPVQIRVMESRKPPIKIIAPGKVYRCDADVTHSPMFHQIEGLVIGERITFGDLKGTLTAFLQSFYGADRKVRFRPHYFPFTEPSAEIDVSCLICDGEGCRICKNSGWIEILGAGMVHPRVLEMVGYDPNQVGGFAFGMGVERIAMLRYGVDDIRLFFENDLAFLGQFRA